MFGENAPSEVKEELVVGVLVFESLFGGGRGEGEASLALDEGASSALDGERLVPSGQIDAGQVVRERPAEGRAKS